MDEEETSHWRVWLAQVVESCAFNLTVIHKGMMGINQNRETREHRKCCPDALPIQVRIDYMDMIFHGSPWRFRHDSNLAGDHFLLLPFWLRIEFRPRLM